MEHIKCALCGSVEHRTLLNAEDHRLHTTCEKFDIVECRRCGLVYINPRPTKTELSKFYTRGYYGEQNSVTKGVVTLSHRMRIQKIMRFKKEGLILDVGCGDGNFLYLLKQRGWETYGVDVSEEACELAKLKMGSNIFNCTLDKCRFNDRVFAVVTLNHVLEHMPDPNKELQEINRVLKDDGFLFVSVPNIDSLQFNVSGKTWIGLDVPRHLYHYSPRTLTGLLERNGFRVIELTYPLFNSPLGLFRSLKAKWFSKKLKLIELLVLPFILIVSILIQLYPNWRGGIEIAAQKISSSKFSEKEIYFQEW